MTLHELGFGKIILLEDDLAEVIINQGVDLTEKMVDEYHDFLRNHLQAPFSLLVNKLNDYSYTFAAQKKLGIIPEIQAMAVVSYKEATERVTQLLITIPREVVWNLRMFSERDLALAWLYEVQAETHCEACQSQ